MADKVSTIFAPTNQKYYAPASNQPKSKGRKVLALVLVILGLGLSSYFGYILVSRLASPSAKPYLYADVYFGKANVFVDDAQVGETPLENVLVKKGQHKVKLDSGGVLYETSMDFLTGSPSLVKRDLGVDQIFSGGLDLWYEKSGQGHTLSIISEPSEAAVFIDGTESGKTPYSNDKLTEGAYEIRLEKEGYEPISERINVVRDLKINTSFKLFPMPAPASVTLMDGSETIYDMVVSNNFIVSNPQHWAKALIYWNKTRGINIMGFGTNRDLVFNNVLDFNGIFYDTAGEIVTPENVTLGSGKIAYLRRESDGPGVSAQAKESLTKIGTAVASGKSAKVKDTPTGWLRVRSLPSLDGQEVGRLNIGDVVTVTEEKPGWLKIKSTAGLEGWASSDYLQLQ